MKYGAMNFPVADLLQEIDRIGVMEFDYIEIAMDPPMAHHSIISARPEEIQDKLQHNGLDIICHLPTFVTTADLTESLRRASVQEMLQSLRTAAALGTGKVVLHPSMAFGMGMFVMDTVRKYAFEFLQEITTTADSLDITLCLENMMPRNMFGVEPHEFEEIFAKFPNMMLTLDTGHAHIGDSGGDRLVEFVHRFPSRIGHLHFSDNSGKRDEHLGVGKGTVDFPRLVDKLKQTGYDGTLTLEVFDEDPHSLPDSRERVKTIFS